MLFPFWSRRQINEFAPHAAFARRVGAFRVAGDYSDTSDAVVEESLSRGFSSMSGVTMTAGPRVRVAGAAAFLYHATGAIYDGAAPTAGADLYFVMRGHDEVEVDCEWKDDAHEADVQAGCLGVLASLELEPADVKGA